MKPKTPGQLMLENRFGLPPTPPPDENPLDLPFPNLLTVALLDDTQPSKLIRMGDTQPHTPGSEVKS